MIPNWLPSTDFVSLNYLLKTGGLLAIDDLQLGSCRLLCEMLIQPGGDFTLLDRCGKLAVLRKDTARRLPADFSAQGPLLERLSGWLGELP